MGVTHAKVSTITDGADTTLVRPSDWNQAHVITFDSSFALSADITPTALSADVNDYNPTGLAGASTLRLSTNSGTQRNITGLEGGTDGRILFIHNLGPGNVALIDASTLSTAPNRFALAGTAADLTLPTDGMAILQYDGTTARWRAARGVTAATNVTFTPTGTVAATDVQTAIEEILAETVHAPGPWAKAGTLTAPSALGFRWYNDTGRTLTFVSARASVVTAPTGAALVCDLNVDGSTVFGGGTKISIAAGTNTIKQTTFATTTIADGHYCTADIDSVGSSVAGADLSLQVFLKG